MIILHLLKRPFLNTVFSTHLLAKLYPTSKHFYSKSSQYLLNTIKMSNNGPSFCFVLLERAIYHLHQLLCTPVSKESTFNLIPHQVCYYFALEVLFKKYENIPVELTIFLDIFAPLSHFNLQLIWTPLLPWYLFKSGLSESVIDLRGPTSATSKKRNRHVGSARIVRSDPDSNFSDPDVYTPFSKEKKETLPSTRPSFSKSKQTSVDDSSEFNSDEAPLETEQVSQSRKKNSRNDKGDSIFDIPDPWSRDSHLLPKECFYLSLPAELKRGEYGSPGDNYYTPPAAHISEPDLWSLMKFLRRDDRNCILLSRPLLHPATRKMFRQFGLMGLHEELKTEFKQRKLVHIQIDWFPGCYRKEHVAFHDIERYSVVVALDRKKVYSTSINLYFDSNPFTPLNWENDYYELVSPTLKEVIPFIDIEIVDVEGEALEGATDGEVPVDIEVGAGATDEEGPKVEKIEVGSEIVVGATTDGQDVALQEQSALENVVASAQQPASFPTETVQQAPTAPENVVTSQDQQPALLPKETVQQVPVRSSRIASKKSSADTALLTCKIAGMQCKEKPIFGFHGATFPTHCQQHKQDGQTVWKKSKSPKKITKPPPTEGSALIPPRTKRMKSSLVETPAAPKDLEEIVKKAAKKSTPPGPEQKKSLRAMFEMDEESSPIAQSKTPQKKTATCRFKDCDDKATYASTETADGVPILCDEHGKDLPNLYPFYKNKVGILH
jgi:hypothetical protein